ncbi:MAG: hypothetical protein JST28_21160 [Acidobacteria bacterium]|nr:hypothetical protein [Acidobacteriota bacterium]
MYRIPRFAFAFAAVSLLFTGCKSNSRPVVGSPLTSKVASSGPATADQVAKELRGNVPCPAKLSNERLPGEPVDDVVGVHPGMALDEAANVILCDDPHLVVKENASRGYNINTYGQHVRQGFDAKFAEARVVKTSAQIMQDMQDDAIRRGGNAYVAPLQPGQIRYYVSSMGMPGQERVLSVAREEYFVTGKLPAVDSLKQALIAKYGEPTQSNGSGAVAYIWWEYEPSGSKIAAGSALSSACRINASPDSGTSLSTQCGPAVGALIQSSNDNPGLARSLAVTAQNGSWGYSVLKSTEEGLRKNDELRRARELSDASRQAAKPKI